MTPEEKILTLGLELPQSSAPAANYTNAVQAGSLLYVAGKAPLKVDGILPKGRLGAEISTDQGYAHARSACFDIIAVLKAELGELSRVARIVEIQGFINAVPEFEDHALVMNGASDLLVEIFGDKGIHTRSVLGANSLRSGVPIIIKGVVEVTL